jgi:hypothetical protein
MAEKMAVIHKQIIKLTTSMVLDRQAFEVPVDAEMVDINWDTREFDGIAFWYKTHMPDPNAPGEEVKYWSFFIRGTGFAYPDYCTHLATVVRDGFAWHVLDADGKNVNWESL